MKLTFPTFDMILWNIVPIVYRTTENEWNPISAD